jgi:hypothetical protein
MANLCCPDNWSRLSPAQRRKLVAEKTIETFTRAGLYHGEPIDRTKIRRMTVEQKNREDQILDDLLEARLRK